MTKIIKFGKPGCEPCEQVDTFLKSQNIEFASINPFDIKSDVEADLILENKVITVPVTILVDENNKTISRKAGFNEKALSHLINQHVNG